MDREKAQYLQKRIGVRGRGRSLTRKTIRRHTGRGPHGGRRSDGGLGQGGAANSYSEGWHDPRTVTVPEHDRCGAKAHPRATNTACARTARKRLPAKSGWSGCRGPEALYRLLRKRWSRELSCNDGQGTVESHGSKDSPLGSILESSITATYIPSLIKKCKEE